MEQEQKLRHTAPYTINESHDLVIPMGTAEAEWQVMHSSLLAARFYSRRWLDQSRDYGIETFGEEGVNEFETQQTLDLGINIPPPKPDVNGEGKAKGLISIEGIYASYNIWHRTVEHLIPTWDKDRVERALEFLLPMEAQAQALRDRLEVVG